MSKKLFKRLIKSASTPVPKEQDKQRHPDSYNGNLYIIFNHIEPDLFRIKAILSYPESAII